MKKPLLIAGGVVAFFAIAIVGIIAVQLLRSDDANLATEAPPIARSTGDAGADSITPAPTTTALSSDNGLPEGVREFVIVPEESEAKYVVRESLRGITTNAVGTTRAIEGSIFLTEEGLFSAGESRFRVDLSTLTSDEGMRDNFIKRNTLQTSQYPFAEFVIEAISGFPEDYAEDTEVEMTISGSLTIRDVSKPVTWSVKARHLGDVLSAVADLTITFRDFGMQPPSVPIATAQDEIQLQVVLMARAGT